MSKRLLFFPVTLFKAFAEPGPDEPFRPWEIIGSRKCPAFLMLSRGVTSLAKLVYQILLEHGNAEGIAWPAIDRIAFLAGASTSAVEKALAALRGTGYIRPLRAKVVDREGAEKKRPSTRYVFPYSLRWRMAIRYQQLASDNKATCDEAIGLLIELLDDWGPVLGIEQQKKEVACWRRVYRDDDGCN